MNEWLVWQVARSRAKAAITKDDIGAAIAWFREISGKEPKSIALNKCNEKFYNLDDFIICWIGGVSRCEIWLSDTDMSVFHSNRSAGDVTEVAQDTVLSPQDAVEPPLLASPMKTVAGSFETPQKIPKKHAGGRPEKIGGVSRTTEWRRAKQLVML